MRYALLLTLLGGYKVQIPCCYTNAIALWDEVHITSVLPPEKVYQSMVQEHRHLDKINQLLRRITAVVIHEKTKDGKYRKKEIPMKSYVDYETMIREKDIPEWVKDAEAALKDEEHDQYALPR